MIGREEQLQVNFDERGNDDASQEDVKRAFRSEISDSGFAVLFVVGIVVVLAVAFLVVVVVVKVEVVVVVVVVVDDFAFFVKHEIEPPPATHCDLSQSKKL